MRTKTADCLPGSGNVGCSAMWDARQWREMPFGMLANVRSGFAFKTSEWRTSGVRVVKIGNVKSGRLDMEGCSFVSPTTAKNTGFMLQRGDLVLGLTGYVGDYAVVRNEGPLVLNQRVGKVTPRQNVDPYFVACVVSSPEFRAAVERASHGSAQANVSPGSIESIEVLVPPLSTQRGIAEIIRSLDDKIELNRKMNETLEAMARAIFKSWFVDFDPVHAKAAGRKPEGMDTETARLFPDGFVESELGLIPRGWEIHTIGDLLSLEYGKALKESDRQPGHVLVFGSNGVVGRHTEPLVRGSGIVVGRKGNPGIVKWAPSDFFVIDTAFYVQTKNNHGMRFLFHQLDGLGLARLSADSAVPGVNRNAIYEEQIVVPPNEVVEHFEILAQSLAFLAEARERESETLSRVRDELLPRLLSGELAVGCAAKKVEASR